MSQLVPAFLHLKAIGSKKGMWLVIEDWIVIVVFIGVMIICTGSSVVDMINKLKHFILCFPKPVQGHEWRIRRRV